MIPLFVALLTAALIGSLAYALTGLARHEADADLSVADSRPTQPVTRGSVVAVALAGFVVAGVVLGLLAREIERQSPLVRWDDTVEGWASAEAGPVSTDALRLITHLGDTVTIVVIGSVGCAWLLWKRQRRLALFLVSVVVGQWLLSNLIKGLVARDRPALDPLAPFSGFSFPSGHSTAAAATYLALALIVGTLHARRHQRWLIALGVGIGAAVGASRMLLGVHWFSDVVGGLLLGWTWCLTCAAVFGLIGQRHTSPRSAILDR
ncbi:MAG: phosphatase PAP2 family protein [Actinomycetes bacterium]